MLCLSDSEVEAILTAAKPIPRHLRRAFLTTVATELEQLGDRRGEGSAHRVIVAIARSYFDPPTLSGDDAA
jgi:hypothetical protein